MSIENRIKNEIILKRSPLDRYPALIHHSLSRIFALTLAGLLLTACAMALGGDGDGDGIGGTGVWGGGPPKGTQSSPPPTTAPQEDEDVDEREDNGDLRSGDDENDDLGERS